MPMATLQSKPQRIGLLAWKGDHFDGSQFLSYSALPSGGGPWQELAQVLSLPERDMLSLQTIAPENQGLSHIGCTPIPCVASGRTLLGCSLEQMKKEKHTKMCYEFLYLSLKYIFSKKYTCFPRVGKGIGSTELPFWLGRKATRQCGTMLLCAILGPWGCKS